MRWINNRVLKLFKSNADAQPQFIWKCIPKEISHQQCLDFCFKSLLSNWSLQIFHAKETVQCRDHNNLEDIYVNWRNTYCTFASHNNMKICYEINFQTYNFKGTVFQFDFLYFKVGQEQKNNDFCKMSSCLTAKHTLT